MCGICGCIGEDRECVARMTEALIHRGPDGNGVHVGHGVSLGHARLAILDPSPAGAQPMWNAERTAVIVFNGEIYNFHQLREKHALQCSTKTDTEVLLRLYEKEGIGFVRRLRGMFAFGLYDLRTSELHIVRDSFGIKPLYIAMIGGRVHFASEMRALMSVMPTKPSLNLKSLSAYMKLQYVPGPETMCEGITSVPPGTILTFGKGATKQTSFAPDESRVTVPSKREFRDRFPDIMQRVVERHMIADKPIGLFLSGGMDSSIVLHHMAAASKSPVKTFTVRFEASAAEDAERFNRDADLALLTARHYGTDHEELLLTAEEYRRLYKDCARALDLPNADSVAVAQFALARMAKKKVDVVLSGAGGDEFFGGYPRYRIARILDALRWIPGPLRSLGAKMLGYPTDVLGMQPGPELALRLLGRPDTEIQSIVRGSWYDPEVSKKIFAERSTRERAHDPVRAFMEADRGLWLVDESLKLSDAVTMASGLECRVPFIDAEVMAWSHATPSRWNVGFFETKALLKSTYRGLLPDHLFTLKKASFYPPLAKWLRRECSPLAEESLEHPLIRELFRTDVLRQILDLHKERKRYGLHQLSNTMQLRFWLETVYEHQEGK